MKIRTAVAALLLATLAWPAFADDGDGAARGGAEGRPRRACARCSTRASSPTARDATG